MNFTLAWDNEQQTCVRCDIRGFIGQVDWLVPINDMAGMALIGDEASASSLIIIPFWSFPFPNRPFKFIKQAILAGQSYGLGKVVIVASNPITRRLLNTRLMDSDITDCLFVVANQKEGRDILH